MVNWGNNQNEELVRCIERGDIDPPNTDGDYLFGKTDQLFKGFKGDGTPRSRANAIARLRKKLRNYCFDGTLPGRQKQAAGELFTSHSLFLPALSIPILIFSLAHVSELDISGEDDDDDNDDNSYYSLEEEDTKMQDSPAANKAVKKPPPSKPDPTAAITSGLEAASLSQKFVRHDLSIKFPVTVSPMGYFRDGQMRICVDFQGIGMDFENYRAETSGKTLKLFMFMRIPRKFIDPNRVDGELAAMLNDRDTIASAQQETANMIYRQYGNGGNIWSPPPSCGSSI